MIIFQFSYNFIRFAIKKYSHSAYHCTLSDNQKQGICLAFAIFFHSETFFLSPQKGDANFYIPFLYLFLNSLGVIPTFSLNILLKLLSSLNPHWYIISLIFISVELSILFAAESLQLIR